MEINDIKTVNPINIGLSDREDVLQINVSENGYDAWNSFAHIDDGKFHATAEARVRKLDDVIKDESIGEVALVKLDVEGWEKFVLYGGEHFFKTQSPVVMVEFTESNTFAAGYQVQELFDILESWGYHWYRYKSGALVPEVKQLHYPYDNLFAIKSLDGALQRLK
ncbi:FkbM family methyltransferase [Hymenobacter humi]|uniref:FkbM family methyltransferase n=1 Tax=Hymenobacter humi TaxID=1411620 RepID=A0ABW2U982_9BACT